MQKNDIPLVPHCCECYIALPYEGAPHSNDCSLSSGNIPCDPVEWTVYSLYNRYPDIVGKNPWTRWYVFNHLFFVCGSGYEWVEGNLIDVCTHDHDWKMGQEVRVTTAEDLVREFYPEKDEHARQDQAKRYENAWRENYHKDLIPWYPFDMDFCNLGRIPDTDIHQSWVLAACDAIRMYQLDAQPQLIELRSHLFDRLQIAVPAEEMCMTKHLLQEKNTRDFPC